MESIKKVNINHLEDSMNSFKLGFIGVGVMGEAIINGIISKQAMKAGNLFVNDIDRAKLIHMVDTYGVNACTAISELVEKADIIFMAVKPVVCQAVLEEISPKLHGKAIFSIVAGWSTLKIKKYIPEDTRVLSVMPNVAAISGEAMSVMSANNSLTHDELQFAHQIFGSFGETETMDEKYFDIVTGISGSGPAYVFMFIEAMTEAGIYNGVPAKTARKLAAQTVLGAAKMLKMSDRHPADLRDAVCTPGGTTIEAVMELENKGFNGIVMSAVDKCAKKYKQMVNNQ
jgi:pyrroline-5-carboxylate reductase